MKFASLMSVLVIPASARLHHPDSSNRDLMGTPGFIVSAKSTRGSKVAWRVFLKDDTPSVQNSSEDTVKFVAVHDYQDGKTRVDLKKGEEYCLRVYKGSSYNDYGSRYGTNTLEVLYFDGFSDVKTPDSRVALQLPDLEVQCFTAEDVDDYYSSNRELCIYTNEAEDVTDCSIVDGHAALYLEDETNSYSIHYYGLWPDDHPAIEESGLSNGRGSDVRVDFYGDKYSVEDYPFIYCKRINTRQFQKFQEEVSKSSKWTLMSITGTNNCASFASEVFSEVTGIDVDADDWLLGADTVCELGKSIVELNDPFW